MNTLVLPAELIGESDAWGLSRRTVVALTLQTADRELLEALREKLAGELADSVRVLDEIADLNREKLEIDVPQEVLGLAGLAA
ncbi:MAG: hypothetical protein IT514_03775 [Burkholderiales bacterium]|nr:hypothetical protein [Burkholderiales bacterium]